MSAAIGPGDWVECVTQINSRHAHNIVVGGVYQVAEVIPIGTAHPLTGTTNEMDRIQLVGHLHGPSAKDGYSQWGWPIKRFRPIYRPNSSILTGLLENKYSKEKETA